MTISTVVSSYELLVKPLVQKEADILGAGRTIIQGYFLTITNLDPRDDVKLELSFKAKTPNFNQSELLAFFDVDSNNKPLSPEPGTSVSYTVTVPSEDTGLFILQPNVALANVVEKANVEIRGYVTATLTGSSKSKSFDLLFTPQQRGTFLPKGFKVPTSSPNPNAVTKDDFDQLAYGLPTAMGGALVTLGPSVSARVAPNGAAVPALA